jgi:type VI protein secretion system component VasK
VWPGPGTRSFRLSLRLAGGTTTEAQSYDGPWSVFKFFSQADHSSGTVFSWTVTSGRDQQPQKINGKPLVYDFNVATNGPAVFSKEFLSRLKCVVPVSR